MKHLTIYAVFSILLLSSIAYAESNYVPEEKAHYPAWYEIGSYYKSNANNDASGATARGELTFFLPIWGNENHLFFNQNTGKLFEGTAREGNVALGYRYAANNNWVLGGWLGGDYRYTQFDNEMWQFSGGFEALSHKYEARINLYGPTSSPEPTSPDIAEARLVGRTVEVIGGEEVAMQGIDGEIGILLPLDKIGVNSDRFELRAFGGGYYFDDDDALHDIGGVKGRIDLSLSHIFNMGPLSRFSLDYEITDDDRLDTVHEFGARLRLPFSKPKANHPPISNQRKKMLDAIMRDTDIRTGRSTAEPALDLLTGINLDNIAIVRDGGSIIDASNTLTDGGLIILDGTVSGPQSINANQTLVGGSGFILVKASKSKITLPLELDFKQGRVINPGANNNLTLLGSNTHIQGVEIVGDGVAGSGANNGIFVSDDIKNSFLQNVTISDIGDDGIDLGSRSSLKIIGSTIERIDDDGIDFSGNDNRLILSNSALKNIGDNGIFMSNNNVIAVDNTEFDTLGDAVMDLEDGNNIIINNIRASNFDDGIITDDVANLILTNSTFTNSADNMLSIDPGSTLLIKNNTFSGTSADSVINFSGASTILPGSTGNVNNTIGNPRLCDADSGTFTGTIEFTDGTVLQDGVAPCN